MPAGDISEVERPLEFWAAAPVDGSPIDLLRWHDKTESGARWDGTVLVLELLTTWPQ
jgi:hypothetical protein